MRMLKPLQMHETKELEKFSVKTHTNKHSNKMKNENNL